MIYVLYFSSSGVPATGLTPTIATYKKVADGADVGSPPAVTAIGGGGYKFSAIATEALLVVVDGGAGLANADRYKVLQITPQDGNLDAPVSSRGSQADLTAVRLKTDNLPPDPAADAGIEAHVLAVLNSYDPPTRAEATADKEEVLVAIAALNNITVGEILRGDISDGLAFPANSLADLVRKLFWMLCNRLVIDGETGAFTAYQGDGTTPGATGTFTDNGRSVPTWP
jgi:hypothetical protein